MDGSPSTDYRNLLKLVLGFTGQKKWRKNDRCDKIKFDLILVK